MSGVQDDTVYEFEIGPFKKLTSKFSEGMLPWLCDIGKNRTESGLRMPTSTNLASKFISDVSYMTKKLDGADSVSFLKFKLFI